MVKISHSKGSHRLYWLITWCWLSITGLKPSTTYYYVAGDPLFGTTEERSFKTLPAVGQFPIRFGLIGDVVTASYLLQTDSAFTCWPPGPICISLVLPDSCQEALFFMLDVLTYIFSARLGDSETRVFLCKILVLL